MRRTTLLILGLTMSLAALFPALSADAQSLSGSVCSDITVLGTQPLSKLPPKIRKQIIQTLTSDILAVAKATGVIGTYPNFSLKSVHLDALEIPQPTGQKLYIIHWGERLFGVNGASWIVEIDSHGARDLVSRDTQNYQRNSITGWGVQVLSKAGQPYPELVFAERAFIYANKPAVASPDCEAKSGQLYKPVACPVNCFENLQQNHNRWPTDNLLKSDF